MPSQPGDINTNTGANQPSPGVLTRSQTRKLAGRVGIVIGEPTGNENAGTQPSPADKGKKKKDYTKEIEIEQLKRAAKESRKLKRQETDRELSRRGQASNNMKIAGQAAAQQSNDSSVQIVDNPNHEEIVIMDEDELNSSELVFEPGKI